MRDLSTEHIKEQSVVEEMKTSYITYAMSVIVSRALPDVRDGLKPSQRRILVAMNDLNLGPRSKFRKCAKIAGDTCGNYHPHGDQGVYLTLVRMAQPFSMRHPLVDGQGNFGSIDGDPAAAMRYTEARLTAVAAEMMEDINLETVDFQPNYDETRTEPVVLPSKLPNLLINGATGIAVGMATNIPPHNLGEVADALVHLIDNPEATVADLMKIVPGPDFPTGAVICGRKGIRNGYETGRGLITVRARAQVEQKRSGKKCIVVSEIPYQLNKTTLIEKIVQVVKTGHISGISDVRDESDRDGTRLVVELKRGEDEHVVLNQLYTMTPLQSSYSIIMLALINGRPGVLSLRDMLVLFRNHREEVTRRRTRFLLRRAEERAHILEGLLVALDRIDEVIALIRKSPDVPTARAGLMKKFKLSERQADAILQMRLQRLTALERESVEHEHEKLMVAIADYKAILAEPKRVLDIIRAEILAMKEKYVGGKRGLRRTEIIDDIGEFNIEDLIAEENVAVLISNDGYIKRMPLSSYRKQRRGGQGVIGAGTKEGDFLAHLFVASTHDYILFFTDAGRVHWLRVYDIPQLPRYSKGRAIVNMLEIPRDERITSLIPARSFEEGNLVMATAHGVVKKTALAAYGNPRRGGIIAINLDEGDRVIKVVRTNGSQEVMLGTRRGKAIRFQESQMRAQGRTTRGVTGIKLGKGDEVVGMLVVDPHATVLTVCENGYGKRTGFEQYRAQKRAGLGLINIKTTDRNGMVVAMCTVSDRDALMMTTHQGMMIQCPVADIRTIGRNTQGVRLIRLKEDDKFVAAAKIVFEEDQDNGPAAEAPPDEAKPPQDEPAEDKPKAEKPEAKKASPKKSKAKKTKKGK